MNRQQQQGWTLVELAVALVIAALITAAIVPLIPLGTRVAAGDVAGRELDDAQQAIIGYARAQGRLPSADSDGDGKQDAGRTTGWLPNKTLDLPPRIKLRYEVRPSLQESTHSYTPQLPGAFAAQLSSTPGGLDLCMKLLGPPEASLTLPGMPAAFALLHPEGIGNEARDIATTPPGGIDRLSGARLAALGNGELAGRLACMDRVARVQGAALNAQTAYSADQIAEFNAAFRDFDVDVAELVLAQANTGLAFAGLGLAQALIDQALAVILTYAGWPPDGTAIAIGVNITVMVGEHGNALGSIGYAIYQLNLASKDVESGKEGLETAQNVAALAVLQQARANNLYKAAGQAAVNLNDGGIKQ